MLCGPRLGEVSKDTIIVSSIRLAGGELVGFTADGSCWRMILELRSLQLTHCCSIHPIYWHDNHEETENFNQVVVPVLAIYSAFEFRSGSLIGCNCTGTRRASRYLGIL